MQLLLKNLDRQYHVHFAHAGGYGSLLLCKTRTLKLGIVQISNHLYGIIACLYS